jgi:hypothetical protein
MPTRLAWILVLLLASAPAIRAQASPYIPLDDPSLPLLEHLIARGEIEDPSPFVRPFRRADAVRALDSALAQATVRDSGWLAELRRRWTDDPAEARWEVAARAGGQAFTHARRDPLHPAGPDQVKPVAELSLQAVFDNVVLVSRPALEPGIIDDPDWPGRKDLEAAGRHREGYISAQFKYIRVYYGEMDQNWGPVGPPGIGISDYGYPQSRIGFEAGNDRLRLSAQASTLADTDTSASVVHRYFFAHRLDVRLTRRFTLGLWETVILAGPSRSFDARYRNPVTLLLLANEYGVGDRGNTMIGLDAAWRLGRGVTLSGQFGLDDFQYQNRSGPTRLPDRYAFTLAGTGPFLGQSAWRAFYTQASSLALQAGDPFESFVDQGVGLGRSFVDNDQLTLIVTAPIARRWLVSPELTLLRQGEGRLSAPFPVGTQRGDTPTLFIGVVERTWRAALGVSGEQGPLRVRAAGGLHYIQNRGHARDRNRTRFEGRIEAMLGLGARGRF